MSEEKLLDNEGTVEILTEGVTSNRSGLSKIVMVGAVMALGVATVIFIKKRRAKQLAEAELVIVEEESTTKKKSNKTEE